jgi:uncharacterized protein YjbI with pentapeptide repeats
MAEMLLVGSVVSTCVITLVFLFLFVRTQRQGIERLHAQQNAWERAQDVRKKKWEEQQETYLSNIKQALLSHVDDLYAEKQQHIKQEMAHVVYELGRIPGTGDTPLPVGEQVNTNSQQGLFLPLSFQGSDLSGFDLSSRNLRYADLRNTDLTRANLFMADLCGACLRGANLSEADLTAANLTNADLTGANLTSAIMLVTDLKNTILVGATLLKARQLTTEQVYSAVADGTTQLDSNIEITLPRIPRIPPA